MSPRTYTNETTQQSSDYPTSPWTETFHFCAAESAQAQPTQDAASRPAESESQSPTHEALSLIYNRDY